MNNQTPIMDMIKKYGQFTDVSEVKYFEGFLDNVGKVIIEVHDRGPDDDLRYAVVARTVDLEKERTATGNPAADLDVVMATVHWDQLKRD